MTTFREQKLKLTCYTDKAGRQYILAYKNVWDRVKKQSRTAERIHVGPLVEDGSIAMSAQFLERFPEFEGKSWCYLDHDFVEQAYFEATCRVVEEDDQEDDAEFDEEAIGEKVRSFGATYALEAMAQKHGLVDSLEKVFGSEDGKNLLNLAIYSVLSHLSSDSYRDWLSGNFISKANFLSGQRISELLSRVNTENINAYWADRNVNRQLIRKEGQPDICALDSTSISTYSDTIIDAEYGHNKQDENLRQVNLSVVCDQTTGEVIYGHYSKGSIPDVVMLKDMCLGLQNIDVNLQDIILILDRGYMSAFNVDALLRSDVSFVLGAKERENAVKTQFKRQYNQLRSIAFRVPEIGLYTTTYHDKNWGTGSAVRGGREFKGVYLHLYRDRTKAAAIIQDMDDMVKRTQDLLNAGKSVDPECFKTVKRYLKKTKEGQWQFNLQALEELEATVGCFALWSDIFADPVDALKHYRQRNIIEQGFNVFKNSTGGRRLRTTEKTYRGKIFVHLLAQSLMMMLYHVTTGKKVPGDSIPNLLTKLSNIRAEKRTKAVRWVVDSLSKKQRDWLVALLELPAPPRFIRD